MAIPKEKTTPLRVVRLSGSGQDSLADAINHFLRWETRSRDSIKVKRCYIDVAADLEAGVLLSQIIYWHLPDKEGESKLTVQRDGHWWLAKAREDWWDECRLTPKQFDRAIRHLEKKQLVVTKVYKWHSTNTKHIRVDWAGLLQALSMLDADPQKVVGFRRREVVSLPRPKTREAKQPSPELPNSQSSRFPNSQSSRFPNSQSSNSLIVNPQIPYQSSSELPISQLHLYTEITSDTTNKDYSSPLTPQGEEEKIGHLANFEEVRTDKRVLHPQQPKLLGKETSTQSLEKPPQLLEQLGGEVNIPQLDIPPRLPKPIEKQLNQTCSDASFSSPPPASILPFQKAQTSNHPQQHLPSEAMPLEKELAPSDQSTDTQAALKSDRSASTDSIPGANSAITQTLKQAEDLRWGRQKILGKDAQGQWLSEMIEAIYLSSPKHYSIQIGELKGQQNYHHCTKALDRIEREAHSGKNEAISSLKSFAETANSLIAQRQCTQQVTQARQLAEQIPNFPMMPYARHIELVEAYLDEGEEAFLARVGWHQAWLDYAQRYFRKEFHNPARRF